MSQSAPDRTVNPPDRTLDDWYVEINRTYTTKNFSKELVVIFAHIVEAFGALSRVVSRHVPNTQHAFDEAMTRTIAWWMALTGRAGVTTLSGLLWVKFPGVCPYCLQTPHDAPLCAEARGGHSAPRWTELGERARTEGGRPRSLADWQRHFNKIYPLSHMEVETTTLAQFSEELGELGEAVRVFEVSPDYFVNEVADVFSWLMRLQNLAEFRNRTPVHEWGRRLEHAMSGRYGNGCPGCHHRPCDCPPVLQATLGRIAEQAPVGADHLFGRRILDGRETTAVFHQQIDARLRFGQEEIVLSSQNVLEIQGVLKELLRLAQAAAVNNKSFIEDNSEIFAKLDSFGSGMELTQASVSELMELVRSIPDASPQAVDYVNNYIMSVGGSAWATVLIRLLGGY